MEEPSDSCWGGPTWPLVRLTSRYFDHVLVSLRPQVSGLPLVAIMIRKSLLREGTRCYTVVLNCHQRAGAAWSRSR